MDNSACGALTAHGLRPELDTGTTDANVPMSLGIPAITIAADVGDRVHSFDAWLEVGKEAGMRRLGIVPTTLPVTAGLRN
jgi:tripeptide aminopeptidase